MSIPTQLKYTKDHEWADIKGKVMTIGITDHAQSALGDIVYIDVPKVGRELKKGEVFGVVESIKAVSDLYSPASGKVLEANGSLAGDPSIINRACYDSWMIKIELGAEGAPADLMDSGAYEKYVATLK